MSDFLIGPTALENLYRVAGIIIQQPWRVGAWIHGGVCAKWAAGNRRARLALGNDGKIFLKGPCYYRVEDPANSMGRSDWEVREL